MSSSAEQVVHSVPTITADRISFSLIAAVTRDYGLGNNGQLPWTTCKLDMNWFRKTTENSTIIMGRRTFESCQGGLQGRINIVLTRNSEIRCPVKKRKLDTDVVEVYYCSSLDHALIVARYYNRPIFIIGGSEVYREALSYDAVCKEILLTHLDIKLPVTCYFPLFSAEQYAIKSILASGTTDVVIDNKTQIVKYEIIQYTKPVINVPRVSNLTGPSYIYFGESGYLKCISDILRHCDTRADRTGVGTLALYGTTFRYDLSHSFPLFTTKRVFWKGVVAELLWFLSGSTDVDVLQRQGVHIWDGNSSREYLDKVGLYRNAVGDIGPSYGFQFRHSGADYGNRSGPVRSGFDQVAYVINELKTNPTGRRAIISLWNPSDLSKMAIPPCLYSYQFWVDNSGQLSCLINQRSGDLGLGIPFNVASASLLTYMIGHLTGHRPKELIHNVADTHIYLSHIEQLRTQIKRVVRPHPILQIVDRAQQTVDDFVKTDFNLSGYYPDEPIKMDMAV